MQKMLDRLTRALGKSKRIHSEQGSARVENPHHDPFAPDKRIAADAKVEGPVITGTHRDTSILWHTSLRDIHLAHPLDTRDDSLPQHRIETADFVEDSVYSVAHMKRVVRLGVQMNV